MDMNTLGTHHTWLQLTNVSNWSCFEKYIYVSILMMMIKTIIQMN